MWLNVQSFWKLKHFIDTLSFIPLHEKNKELSSFSIMIMPFPFCLSYRMLDYFTLLPGTFYVFALHILKNYYNHKITKNSYVLSWSVTNWVWNPCLHSMPLTQFIIKSSFISLLCKNYFCGQEKVVHNYLWKNVLSTTFRVFNLSAEEEHLKNLKRQLVNLI